MKINIKKFLNIFKTKERLGNKSQFCPHRDWNIMLWFLLIASLALIVASFYLFEQIKNTEIFSSAKSGISNGEVLINQNLLDSTLSSFDLKAQKTADFSGNKIIFSDPK